MCDGLVSVMMMQLGVDGTAGGGGAYIGGRLTVTAVSWQWSCWSSRAFQIYTCPVRVVKRDLEDWCTHLVPYYSIREQRARPQLQMHCNCNFKASIDRGNFLLYMGTRTWKFNFELACTVLYSTVGVRHASTITLLLPVRSALHAFCTRGLWCRISFIPPGSAAPH
jgi:hypothetical protein